MKKILAVVLTLAMLAACASGKDEPDGTYGETTDSETIAETSEDTTDETTDSETSTETSEETTSDTSEETAAEETASEQPVSDIIIGCGNIINGNFAYDDGWIYYSSEKEFCVYKMRGDGSEKTMIADHKAYYINIYDGWIYYCFDGIRKMRLDGSGDRQLYYDLAPTDLNVSGGWIYYCVNEGGGLIGIFKMRLDGSEMTQVRAGVTAYWLTVVENRIYYTDAVSGALYRINTDGTEETRIFVEKGVCHINIAGDWIYYEAGYGDLCKMRINGAEWAVIKKECMVYFCFNVAGDWVYYEGYYDAGNSSALFKIRTDGTEETLLDAYPTGELSIIGDWIYYYSDCEDDGYYRIRTDGTDKQKL